MPFDMQGKCRTRR